MAIQNRRGAYQKLDTSKLLPGEYAIVLQDDPFCKDGKAIYICFRAGDTKRVATYEDMVENIEDATEEVRLVFTEEVRAATREALEKALYANEQGTFAKEQGTYAKGTAEFASSETGRIQKEFETIRNIILETESGQILLEVKKLLEDMYHIATDIDILQIIDGTYVDEDEMGSIFETGSNQDIDEMIAGTYVDGPEEEITDQEVDSIINHLFK